MTPDLLDHKVLDHGYVRLVEAWGGEHQIIEAARMSTNKGFRGWERETAWECPKGHYAMVNDHDPAVGVSYPCPHSDCDNQLVMRPERSHPGDLRLLKYLYTHKHMTPFEMVGATFEVQAPIFVFREWHRHRTQSYNEMSARYTPIPNLHYVPSVERLLQSGGANKQAQGATDGFTAEKAEHLRVMLREHYEAADGLYQSALLAGAPKELARLMMPVGRYSRMRASANLRNWLQFLQLRMAENAQWEIRQYAHAVCEMLEKCFPRTIQLFLKEKRP